MVQEPEDDLSPLDQEVAQELGPVRFRCRRRSQKAIQTSLSGDSALSYVTPFFAGLAGLLALMLAFAGLKFSLDPDPQPLQAPLKYILWGVLVAWARLCTGASFWWTFRRPRKATLVMHRDGFREGHVRVPYADLARIWIGREPSKMDRGAMAMGRFAESTLGGLVMGHARHQIKENAKVAEASRKARILLEGTDGKAHPLTNFLIHYDAGDIERFFREVRRNRPELPLVGEIPTASTLDSI